jgi:N-acetylglucosamine repressor
LIRDVLAKKNVSLVLQVLHLEGAASRARLASLARISRSTVSNIIAELERLGIVAHVGEAEEPGGIGRPGMLIRLNPDSLVVVGVDIGISSSKVMLVRADGSVTARVQVDTDARRDANRTLQQVSEAIESAVSNPAVDRDRIVGIGVSFRGLIDRSGRSVRRSTSLPLWNGLDISQMLKPNCIRRVPVYLENNANSMLLGEARFGVAKGVDNAIGVTVEEGIGGAILINRRLYTGSQGAAAEFGHISIAQAGPICHCGNKGCLRTLSSESAIESNALRIVKTGAVTLLRSAGEIEPSAISTRDVIDAAKRGDLVSREIIAEAATALGAAIINLVNALDPGMVVFSKDLLPTYQPFWEKVTNIIANGTYGRKEGFPRLVVSQLGEDAVCVGAASCVIDRIMGSHER